MQQDIHGLGFDPFKDAEDFREIKRRKTEAKTGSLKVCKEISIVPWKPLRMLFPGSE